MSTTTPRTIAAGLLAAFALAACGGTPRAPARTGVLPRTADQAGLSPAARAKADGGRPPYTAADVHFMAGMIGHHAQAVRMAGWAPTHGASAAVQRLAERIAVAQRDEIAFMQRWLRERNETVPGADASHGHATPGMDQSMPGMVHPPLMPGMLTAEQFAQLDRARGEEFDRLFLAFMIQHHQGALTMVEQLFSAPGAGQEDDVFKFASDVSADQATEIERMSTMLATQPSRERGPQ